MTVTETGTASDTTIITINGSPTASSNLFFHVTKTGESERRETRETLTQSSSQTKTLSASSVKTQSSKQLPSSSTSSPSSSLPPPSSSLAARPRSSSNNRFIVVTPSHNNRVQTVQLSEIQPKSVLTVHLSEVQPGLTVAGADPSSSSRSGYSEHQSHAQHTLTLTSRLTSDGDHLSVITLSHTLSPPVLTSQTETVIITTGLGNVTTEKPGARELGDFMELNPISTDEAPEINPDHVIRLSDPTDSFETFPELVSLELVGHEAESTNKQSSSKENITVTPHERKISDVAFELDENFTENILKEESETELPQDIDIEQTTVLFEDEEQKSETDERPRHGSTAGVSLNRQEALNTESETENDEFNVNKLEENARVEFPLTKKMQKLEGQSRENINIDSKENMIQSSPVHAEKWRKEKGVFEGREPASELLVELDKEKFKINRANITVPESLQASRDNLTSDQESDGSSQAAVIVPRAETQLQENLIIDWISEESEVSNLTSKIVTEKPMSSVTKIRGADFHLNLTAPATLVLKKSPEHVNEENIIPLQLQVKKKVNENILPRKYNLMDPAFHQPIPIIGNREYLGLANQNSSYGNRAMAKNINTPSQYKHSPDEEAFNEIKDILDGYKKKKILSIKNGLWDTELNLTFNITEETETRKKRKIESFIPPAPVRDNNRQLVPRLDPRPSSSAYSAPISSSTPDSCFTETACSSSCGTGFQLLLPDKSSEGCSGAVLRVVPCSPGPCPVSCVWAAWSDWSSCARTDDANPECSQRRRRQVQRRQSAGGRACTGDFAERRFCVSQDCQGEHIPPFFIKSEPCFLSRLSRGGGASWSGGL